MALGQVHQLNLILKPFTAAGTPTDEEREQISSWAPSSAVQSLHLPPVHLQAPAVLIKYSTQCDNSHHSPSQSSHKIAGYLTGRNTYMLRESYLTSEFPTFCFPANTIPQ